MSKKIDWTNWGRKRKNPPKEYKQNYRIPGQDRPPTGRELAIAAADFAEAQHAAKRRPPSAAATAAAAAAAVAACRAPCSKPRQPSAGPSRGAAAAPRARPSPAGARPPSGRPQPGGSRAPSGRRSPAQREPSPPPREPSPSPRSRSPSPPPSREPSPPLRAYPRRTPAGLSYLEEEDDENLLDAVSPPPSPRLTPPRRPYTQQARALPLSPPRRTYEEAVISPPRTTQEQQEYIQRVLLNAQEFHRQRGAIPRVTTTPPAAVITSPFRPSPTRPSPTRPSPTRPSPTRPTPVVALPVEVVDAHEDLFSEEPPEDMELPDREPTPPPPEPEPNRDVYSEQAHALYRKICNKWFKGQRAPFSPTKEPLQPEPSMVVDVAAVDGDVSHPTRIVVPAHAAMSPQDVVVAVPRTGGVARLLDFGDVEEQPIRRVPFKQLLKNVPTPDLRRELDSRTTGRRPQAKRPVAQPSDFLQAQGLLDLPDRTLFDIEMPDMYDSDEEQLDLDDDFDPRIESEYDFRYASQVMPELLGRRAARAPDYDFWSQSDDDLGFLQSPLIPLPGEPPLEPSYFDTSETYIEDYERPSEELYRLVKLFNVP